MAGRRQGKVTLHVRGRGPRKDSKKERSKDYYPGRPAAWLLMFLILGCIELDLDARCLEPWTVGKRMTTVGQGPGLEAGFMGELEEEKEGRPGIRLSGPFLCREHPRLPMDAERWPISKFLQWSGDRAL